MPCSRPAIRNRSALAVRRSLTAIREADMDLATVARGAPTRRTSAHLLAGPDLRDRPVPARVELMRAPSGATDCGAMSCGHASSPVPSPMLPPAAGPRRALALPYGCDCTISPRPAARAVPEPLAEPYLNFTCAPAFGRSGSGTRRSGPGGVPTRPPADIHCLAERTPPGCASVRVRPAFLTGPGPLASGP